MPNRITLRIEGLDRLQRKLVRIGSLPADPVALKALRKGAEPMREAAEQKAPRRPGSGRLARGVQIADRESTPHKAEVAVGIGEDEFYGVFQELADEFGGVHHAAQPFLRPAYDENRRQTVEIVRRELAKAVKREARG